MAAGPWKINPNGKVHLGNGNFDLDAAVFNLTLYSVGASANILTAAVSLYSELAATECSGGSYTSGGNTLSTNTYALSGQNGKFDSSDWVVTGSIASIKYAYIMQSVSASSGFLLCYSTLSATGFDVSGTNTLTIQMNASGIFTLA
jgi:hypothetical protein